MLRPLLLAVGPVVLIGGSFAISRSELRTRAAAEIEALHQQTQQADRTRQITATALADACSQAAARLSRSLPGTMCLLERPPFVLASDLPAAELTRAYDDTVRPLSAALWRSYFDRRPTQPLIVVLMRSEASYRDLAVRWDGYDPVSYDGYYRREERRLLVNYSTGMGTLAHELCHALAQADFPHIPLWFDEGLAALHEETRSVHNGLLLEGVSNWRFPLVRSAAEAGALPRVSALVTCQSFRGEGEGLNYAHARAFCQFLQERGLLSHFYRKLRADHALDPTGLITLTELCGAADTSQLDRQFESWVLAQPQVAPPAPQAPSEELQVVHE